MNRFTARRKLLKGSLSAPLVLTVTSVGANPVTTFAACFSRNDGGADCVREAPAGCDQYYRTAVKLYKDRDNKLFIRESDGSGYSGYCGVQKVSGSYAYVRSYAQPNGSLAECKDENNRDQYVGALCYFDSNDRCSGYAWNTGGGVKVTKSCYASVYGSSGGGSKYG